MIHAAVVPVVLQDTDMHSQVRQARAAIQRHANHRIVPSQARDIVVRKVSPVCRLSTICLYICRTHGSRCRQTGSRGCALGHSCHKAGKQTDEQSADDRCQLLGRLYST